MVETLNPKATLHQTAQLETGDILCFQKAVPLWQQQQQQQQQANLAAAAAAVSGMSVEGHGSTTEADSMEVDAEQPQQQQQGALLPQQQQQHLQQQVLQQQQQLSQQQQDPHAELLQCRFPCVPEFLSYIRNRKLVSK